MRVSDWLVAGMVAVAEGAEIPLAARVGEGGVSAEDADGAVAVAPPGIFHVAVIDAVFEGADEFDVVVVQPGFPFAELLAYLVFFTESVGAICLAIGLFTRIAAAMVGIQMLVITFLFQWQYGYFWTSRGYEFALMWALLCVAIWFRGGGRYSVDHYIGKEF